MAKMSLARGEMAKTEKAGGSSFQALSKGAGLAVLGVAAGAGAIGVASVKMAADFQQNMSKLVTSGGETAKNLKGDMGGVQKLMGETGTSADQLATGLYTINSAGFHGAAGLTVLKAAAEGAKTENADLGTVTDGLTTLLNDYHLKASDAALVTSKMVTATSLGKTTFQDLAGSLHTVGPAANAAGISMDQVLGAMATMTAKGTPAADAATYLRQTILQLENPSHKAAMEMDALGLSSIDVSQHLGQRGLSGTLQLLTDAIAKKMGPAGLVLIDNLKQAAAAGSKWAQNLAAMTPAQQANIQSLAGMGVSVDHVKTAMAGGSKETAAQKTLLAEYQAKLLGMPPAYRAVLAGLVANKLGYTDLNSTIAKLPPTQQTAVAALANMVGGTKSMQAALELTGDSAATFQADIKKVGGTVVEAGGHVAGWSTVQKNFNQQLAEGKGALGALSISLGQALIPVIERTIDLVASMVAWFKQHKTVAIDLAIGLGVLAAAFLAVAVATFVAENAMTLGIGAAIALLIVGVIYVATHWKQVWGDVLTFVKQWQLEIAAALVLLLGPLGIFIAAVMLVALHWKQIWAAMQAVWDGVRDYLKAEWTAFAGTVRTLWNGITGAVTAVWHALDTFLRAVWTGLRDFLKAEWNAFAGTGRTLWNGITGAVTTVWHTMDTGVRLVWTGLKTFFNTEWTAYKAIVKGMWDGIVGVITTSWSSLTTGATALWKGIKAGFVTGIDDVVRGINSVFINPINSALGIVGLKIPDVPLIKAAGGARIGGGGMTSGPAVLVGEGRAAFPEFVIPTDPQHRANARHLTGMLAAQIGMAGGGILGPIGHVVKGVVGIGKNVVGDITGVAGDIANAIRSGAASAIMASINAIAGPLESTLGAIPPKLVGEMASGTMKTAVSDIGKYIAGHPYKPPAGAAGPVGSSFAANQALGQQMAAARGWVGSQWLALNAVEMDEAGWNPTAKNKTSSAYGIAQFINGPGEYATYGGDSSTVVGQITGFLNYVHDRYGLPSAALAHENAFHWYDQGGILPPGLTMAMNATGRDEYVSRTPPSGGGGVTFNINIAGNVVSWDQTANALIGPIRRALLAGAGRNGTNIL